MISKSQNLEIISDQVSQGADAVIFGCTEVGLLFDQSVADIPTFDTIDLHAKAAIDFAIDGQRQGSWSH